MKKLTAAQRREISRIANCVNEAERKGLFNESGKQRDVAHSVIQKHRAKGRGDEAWDLYDSILKY